MHWWIRGWDELFAACSEHLAGLSAMRSSPYFRGPLNLTQAPISVESNLTMTCSVFEEEANSWETRLNTLNNLFGAYIAA